MKQKDNGGITLYAQRAKMPPPPVMPQAYQPGQVSLPPIPRGGFPIEDPERVEEPNRVDILDRRTNETVVTGSIIGIAFEENYANVTLHLDTGFVLEFTGETLIKIATRANTKAVIKRMKGK